MQGVRHRRRSGSLRTLFRVPMDLRHLHAVGKRVAVAGNAGQVGLDRLGISEDHREHVSGVADGDNLPIFVSPELRECETIRHLHSMLVLRGNGSADKDGEHDRNHHHQPGWISRHGSLLRLRFATQISAASVRKLPARSPRRTISCLKSARTPKRHTYPAGANGTMVSTDTVTIQRRVPYGDRTKVRRIAVRT